MDYRIADTFADSLASLDRDEQKSVKTTAFDLQMNSAAPGMQFHRLTKSKDPNFWSVRVSTDLRIIVHRSDSGLLLCGACPEERKRRRIGHHDDAYAWAERRKIERHPTTGAAQLVEVRETVREVVIPKYVEATPVEIAPTPLFADITEETLLSYGVPREWVSEVRDATEATLFDLAEHLPKEAAEALLDLAVGATPQLPAAIPAAADPFAHPDAQRRFRVIESVEELERALDAPWEKWTVFLHPAQRQLVEKSFSGPARVYGSAGTGKTIVALHRAVHLARTNREARVLLATFSPALANALRLRIRQLTGNEPRIGERLEVHSMSSIGHRLYEANFGKLTLATLARIREALADAAAAVDALPAVGTRRFTPYFLWSEWTSVVDAWQLATWEEYRDVKRLGRKTRLPEAQRRTLWSIFEKAKESLAAEGLITEPAMFARLAEKLATLKRPVFDYAVIDEAQDIGIPELRFLAALGANRPNALFFAGDLGQRIFQQPFSWSSLGVDVRGRSSRLRINYRTSHQIRKHADRLLADKLADVDGQTEERGGTISVFNGVPPEIAIERDEAGERARVVAWVKARVAEGLQPHEIAIFVRSAAQLARAEAVARVVGVPYVVLDESVETKHGHLTIATMHLAKGLEFRAVAVMACDDEVIPLQERIEAVTDESDLDDVYATERHLLYVACTRARDKLAVCGVARGSEFLSDLMSVRENAGEP